MNKTTIVLSLLMLLGVAMIAGVVEVNIGISKLKQIIYNQEAQINEYEFLLADMWAEKEHCRKRLGAFYKPMPEEEK